MDEPSDDEVVQAIQNGQVDLSQLELLSSYPGLREFVSAVCDHSVFLPSLANAFYSFWYSTLASDFKVEP